MLKEVLVGLEGYIKETGAMVKVKELPKMIFANPTKMKQLFLNLITNAIKFRKPEVPSQVILSMKDFGDYWKISVADNGIGIRKEFQKQIFMLFKNCTATANTQEPVWAWPFVKRLLNNTRETSGWNQMRARSCFLLHPQKDLKNEEEA